MRKNSSANVERRGEKLQTEKRPSKEERMVRTYQTALTTS
jgi:hypothetical protein